MAKQIAVIDAETDPFLFGRVPDAFIWDIFDGTKHYTFTHISDALHFLSDKNWICYAHNGGKFDYLLPGFLDEINQFDKVIIINGRLANFKVGKCQFRDSYNILPIPLRDFDKGEIDYTKMEKKVRHLHMEEITRYLHRDTESLHKLVSAFRAEYGDGLTLAGSAMKFWQKRTGNKAPKSTRGFYNEVAPYYHGGRVECFHVGEIKGEFQMIDINSAYPFAMLSEHPISVDDKLQTTYKGEEIQGHWLYDVYCVSHGALAVHIKGQGLSFPNDHKVRLYRTTGWELQVAMDCKMISEVSIQSVQQFTKTINFNKYIHYFYDLKKAAKHKTSPDYIFAKLFMNSLYGKFGANPLNYANYSLCEPRYRDAMVADGYEFAGELGPWIVMSSPLEENEERFYNVATAASITGYVRSMLLKAMFQIRQTGGTVLYCDTDSVVFKGKSPFLFSKELGEWGCDGTYSKGGIGGKKLYAFYGKDSKGKLGWKTACKGVRISPEEIMRVARGETVEYRRDAPSMKVKGGPVFITRKVKRTGKVEREGC